MKSKYIGKSYHSFKYSFLEFFSKNKVRIIVCSIFCFVGLLTGIFTAVKIFNLNDKDVFKSFNITYQLSDLENFSANFFNRMLSYLLVVVLLQVFTIHPSLYIFGWCLIAYRAFLVSINCVMIILIFSFNGIIKSLLIIFPCQILMLVIMILFFSFMTYWIKEYRYCKTNIFNKFFSPFVIAVVSLSIINFVETILLLIFRSSVILVI